MLNDQSWEYPLTKEDKKRRVLWLAQLEMAAASAREMAAACDARSESSSSSPRSASIATKEAVSDATASNSPEVFDYLDDLDAEEDLDSFDKHIEEPTACPVFSKPDPFGWRSLQTFQQQLRVN